MATSFYTRGRQTDVFSNTQFYYCRIKKLYESTPEKQHYLHGTNERTYICMASFYMRNIRTNSLTGSILYGEPTTCPILYEYWRRNGAIFFSICRRLFVRSKILERSVSLYSVFNPSSSRDVSESKWEYLDQVFSSSWNKIHNAVIFFNFLILMGIESESQSWAHVQCPQKLKVRKWRCDSWSSTCRTITIKAYMVSDIPLDTAAIIFLSNLHLKQVIGWYWSTLKCSVDISSRSTTVS